jgi:hypothetical protein
MYSTGVVALFRPRYCREELSNGSIISLSLQEAEFIANEFNKLTSVQSAEVVPNMDGYYSVLVTRTDGRRAVSCNLDTAHGGPYSC